MHYKFTLLCGLYECRHSKLGRQSDTRLPERKRLNMPAPTMTPEQRAAALEKARVVRAKRSEITKKLSMGLMTADQALKKADDPVIGRMKVKSFVNALPGFGKVKTEKLMEELGIPESRRIQGLGSKQMENLKAALK